MDQGMGVGAVAGGVSVGGVVGEAVIEGAVASAAASASMGASASVGESVSTGKTVGRKMSFEEAVGNGRWRNDPQVLQMLKLTEKDVNQPVSAMVTEGLGKLWSVRTAVQLPPVFDGEVPEHLREHFAKKAAAEAERQSAFFGYDRPLWQTIAGIDPATEGQLSPREREETIGRLLGAVIKLVRFEMDEAEKQKSEWRSFMWDPLPKVCFYLQISRTKLTQYAKEMMGLSAHEIVDGIRVQKLRERMKESLQGWVYFQVNAISQEIGALAKAGDELSFSVWTRLKGSRRTPKWDRQTWAISLGFPNYARMYRACLVLFGKTPAQLEFEVVEELCAEGVIAAAAAASVKGNKVQNISEKDPEVPEVGRDEVQDFSGVKTEGDGSGLGVGLERGEGELRDVG